MRQWDRTGHLRSSNRSWSRYSELSWGSAERVLIEFGLTSNTRWVLESWVAINLNCSLTIGGCGSVSTLITSINSWQRRPISRGALVCVKGGDSSRSFWSILWECLWSVFLRSGRLLSVTAFWEHAFDQSSLKGACLKPGRGSRCPNGSCFLYSKSNFRC